MNKLFIYLSKGFYLLSANIRSMRANFNTFTTELSQIKNKIHIIVPSEIWIGSDEICLFNVPRFKCFSHCNNIYRPGGILCYINNDIGVNEVNFEMKAADSLLLHVKIRNMHFNLANSIYIRNIHLNTLHETANSQAYKSILNNNGYQSLIDSVTRPISNRCIDHIFIKTRNISAFKSAVFNVDLADHCVLCLRSEPDTRSDIARKISKVIYQSML